MSPLHLQPLHSLFFAWRLRSGVVGLALAGWVGISLMGACEPARALSAPFALPLSEPASAPPTSAVPPAVTPAASVANPSNKRPATKPVSSLLPPFASLDWAQLTAAQRSALAPLAQAWAGLTDAHKRKWISLSENWLRLTPDQQRKLQARMTQWAGLTPRQRETARLMYAEVANLPAATKQAQWQAYQALSADEKQKLRKEQPRLTPRTAIAPKPTAADKMQRVPTAVPGQSKLDPRIVLTTPGAAAQTVVRKASPPASAAQPANSSSTSPTPAASGPSAPGAAAGPAPAASAAAS